jgi:DNA helicase-2/ATP-dependent DNA helicase PcrA
LERERAKEIEVDLANTGEHVNEKEIKALSRLAVRDELASFKAEIDARTEVEPVALYLNLFRDENRIRQFADGFSVPEDWPAMAKQTLHRFERGEIPYEDLLPLLVFSGELEGFRESSTIRHLIIDEAQDYSMMQFELLHQLFPKSLWTVVGDYHQSVHTYLYTADFEKIADMLKVDDAKVIRLHRSYRSTKEIFDFASALLPEGDAVQPLERSGDKPKVCIFAENDELFKRLHEDIRKLQSEGCGSIAIIGKTQADCERIYNELLAKVELHLVKPEDETFEKGVMVIPVYLAKGLEFDGVLLPYVNQATYYREYERKLLYTASTRALRYLYMYCEEALPSFVKDVEDSLYDIVKESEQ